MRLDLPAIDHGINLSVYTDLDGSLHSIEFGFDIGAYEFQGLVHKFYLPPLTK